MRPEFEQKVQQKRENPINKVSYLMFVYTDKCICHVSLYQAKQVLSADF